jgi:hypothetical protein
MVVAVGPPANGLTSVEVDGCFHIFNPATQSAVALNATASNVWRLCTGDFTLAEIVESLAEHYDVRADEIESQVRDVLRDFAAQGLLGEPLDIDVRS